MERIAARIGLSLALAALVAAPGQAQDAPALAAATATPPPVDQLAIGVEELRMTVPVAIAGKGAWPFVIDTGAERTVLSLELAARLGLAPGPQVRVMTMIGTSPTPTAIVPDLRVSRLAPPTIEAPLFAREHLGAIGMLGLDALQGHSVFIDFDKGTMALRPTKRRRMVAMPGEIVVTARRSEGQLIVTDARWRGRRIAVVLDTGSPVTIANRALIAVGRPPPALGPISVTAADGGVLVAEAYRLDGLEIGTATFNGVPVAVADAAPFRRFGLHDRPALLLGMETLRLFRAVEIDFPGRSIRMTLPHDAVPRRSYMGY